MKAKELIYNLKTNFGNVGSYISEAQDEHLLFMLDEARGILAGRKMDKQMNLELMAEYLDIKPVNASSKIYGSLGDVQVKKVDIPPVVGYSGGPAIFTVGTQDGQESFTRVPFAQLRTAMFRKYTAQSPKWFYLDGDIYVINLPMESNGSVRVRAIYANPRTVQQLKGLEDILNPFDFEYPIATKDADSIYKLALSGDMSWGDAAASALSTKASKSKAKQEILDALK